MRLAVVAHHSGAPHQINEKARERRDHPADDDEHDENRQIRGRRHRRVALAEAHRARQRDARREQQEHGEPGDQDLVHHRFFVFRRNIAPYTASPAAPTSALAPAARYVASCPTRYCPVAQAATNAASATDITMKNRWNIRSDITSASRCGPSSRGPG